MTRLDDYLCRLEAEQSARIDAEEKLKSLCNKVNFDANACNQVKKDFFLL